MEKINDVVLPKGVQESAEGVFAKMEPIQLSDTAQKINDVIVPEDPKQSLENFLQLSSSDIANIIFSKEAGAMKIKLPEGCDFCSYEEFGLYIILKRLTPTVSRDFVKDIYSASVSRSSSFSLSSLEKMFETYDSADIFKIQKKLGGKAILNAYLLDGSEMKFIERASKFSDKTLAYIRQLDPYFSGDKVTMNEILETSPERAKRLCSRDSFEEIFNILRNKFRFLEADKTEKIDLEACETKWEAQWDSYKNKSRSR